MTNKPKQIGTAFETGIVRHLKPNGFPNAERIALHGIDDQGDITVCPGVMIEAKGGHAAENASDTQITTWVADTERERVARGADVGILVLKRKGKGAAQAGTWWAVLPGWTYTDLAIAACDPDHVEVPFIDRDGDTLPAVRITLDDAIRLLRHAGYGQPVTAAA